MVRRLAHRGLGHEVKKKIALEVHVKRFKSPEAQVTTVQGTYIFPCAAGSLEPEGRVVSRPSRCWQFQKEGNEEGYNSGADKTLPTTLQSVEREETKY